MAITYPTGMTLADKLAYMLRVKEQMRLLVNVAGEWRRVGGKKSITWSRNNA